MRVLSPKRSLRATMELGLEEGAWQGPFSRALSSIWTRTARPARALRLPPGVAVVGIGGATLGGSGKTPVARELARRLAAAGRSTAVVSHAYLARPGRPRRVGREDRVDWVGDEALMLERALGRHRVPVVVGPRRQQAVDFAAGLASCLLVDGLLQSRPLRLHASLLVLDGSAPWGCGCCPPAGDLRARPDQLLYESDAVLVEGDRSGSDALCWLPFEANRRRWTWRRRLSSLRDSHGDQVQLGQIARLRTGLVTTIARPERLVADLARAGIHPLVHLRFADHAVPRPRDCNVSPRVDVWLTTEKCATKVGPAFDGVPVWTVEQTVELPNGLVEWVLGATERASSTLSRDRGPVVESRPCSCG